MSLSIRSIVEDSLLAYFSGYDATLFNNCPIHRGQTNEDRNLKQFIILHAEQARAKPELGAFWLGNFEVTLKIYIYSSAHDYTLDQHRALVEGVHAIMQNNAAIQAAWVQGTLYQSYCVDDLEAQTKEKFGNVLQYTFDCVYPPPTP
jgi:hypothetical protein